MLISFNKIIDPENYKYNSLFIKNLIVYSESWDITNIVSNVRGKAIENDILRPPHQVTLSPGSEGLLDVHIIPDEIDAYTVTPNNSEYVRSIKKYDRYNLLSQYFDLKLNTLENHIGCINDIIIDTSTWSVAAFLSDSRNWVPMNGRDILIPSHHIITTDWLNKKLIVGQSNMMLKTCPEIGINNGVLLPEDYILTKEHYGN